MTPESEVLVLVYCLGCGCTEHNACVTEDGPCTWVAIDNDTGTGWCSACNDRFGITRLERLRTTVNTLIEALGGGE